MIDDPITLLERELVAAATRRAAQSVPAEASELGGPDTPRPAPVPSPGARRWTGRGPAGGTFPRVESGLTAAGFTPARVGRGLTAVASVAIVVGVSLVALLALHGRSQPAPTAASGQNNVAARSRRALLDAVGVLRRPQTAADRRALRLTGVLGGGAKRVPLEIAAQGTPIPGSARIAAVTPWGTPVVLVMLAPLTATQRVSEGVSPPPAGAATSSQDTTLLMVSPAGLSGARDLAQLRAGQDWSIGGAPDVRAGRDWDLAGAGRRISVARPPAVRYAVVVPDGVARVTFHVRLRGRRGNGTSTGRPRSVTVPVRGNVAVVQISNACCDVPVMTWTAPDGGVIQEISAGSTR